MLPQQPGQDMREPEVHAQTRDSRANNRFWRNADSWPFLKANFAFFHSVTQVTDPERQLNTITAGNCKGVNVTWTWDLDHLKELGLSFALKTYWISSTPKAEHTPHPVPWAAAFCPRELERLQAGLHCWGCSVLSVTLHAKLLRCGCCA